MPRRGPDAEQEAGAEDTPPETAASHPAGLPDPDSVISEEVLTSPKGRRYRVLRTTETDAYDRPEPSSRAEQR